VIKLKFEDLPSFEVMIGEGLDVRIEALEIFAAARKRVGTLLKDRDFQHLRTRFRLLKARHIELGSDLFEEEVWHTHQITLRGLLDGARGRPGVSQEDVALFFLLLSDYVAVATRVSDRSAAEVIELSYNPEAVKQLSENTIERLLYAESDLKSRVPHHAVEAARFVLRYLGQIADPWQLAILTELPVDAELADAALDGCNPCGPLCDASIAASGARVQTLRERHGRIHTEQEQLRTSLTQRKGRMSEAFLSLRVEVAEPAVLTLSVIATRNFEAMACPELFPRMNHAVSQDKTVKMRFIPMSSPWCWSAILHILIVEGNGLSDPFRLREWVPGLLAHMLYHPARMREARVPQEGQRLKSLLAKYIAGAMKALPHKQPEDELTGILAASTASMAMEIVASLIRTCLPMDRGEDGVVVKDSDHAKIMERAWNDLVEPNAEILLRRLLLDLRTIRAMGGVGLLDIMKEEEDAAVTEELPPEPTVVATQAPERFAYIPNPAAPSLNNHEFVLDGDDRETQFETALKKCHVQSIVKKTSILGALRHFLELDQSFISMLPTEETSAGNWYKLKRGNVRILVRIQGDRLLFHVYPRREWERNKLLWR